MTATHASAWTEVSDGVLHGLAHTLSNRVTAIGAVAGVLEVAEPPGAEMIDALVAESRRLHTLLHALRRLPRTGAAVAQPVRLSELLPEVLALHAYDARTGDVPCDVAGDPETLPVMAPEQALAQALLVLVAAAKARARPVGGRVRVRYAGDTVAVTATVETEASAGGVAPPWPAADVAAWLLGASDASVEERATADGVRYALRMPTLTEVRRRAGLASGVRG